MSGTRRKSRPAKRPAKVVSKSKPASPHNPSAKRSARTVKLPKASATKTKLKRPVRKIQATSKRKTPHTASQRAAAKPIRPKAKPPVQSGKKPPAKRKAETKAVTRAPVQAVPPVAPAIRPPRKQVAQPRLAAKPAGGAIARSRSATSKATGSDLKPKPPTPPPPPPPPPRAPQISRAVRAKPTVAQQLPIKRPTAAPRPRPAESPRSRPRRVGPEAPPAKLPTAGPGGETQAKRQPPARGAGAVVRPGSGIHLPPILLEGDYPPPASTSGLQGEQRILDIAPGVGAGEAAVAREAESQGMLPPGLHEVPLGPALERSPWVPGAPAETGAVGPKVAEALPVVVANDAGFGLMPPPPEVGPPPLTGGELPASYGSGRVTLFARDPHWLYAHWDYSQEQLRELDRFAQEDHLTLRLHLDKVQGLPFCEVPLHPESTNWFVNVGRGGTRFIAELGFYVKGAGRWARRALWISERVNIGTRR